MASNVTVEERDEQVDETIKCGICLDYYTDPRILPCSHTFCMNCIKQITDSNHGTFICPFRDSEQIPKIQIDTLIKNRIVSDIVEIIKKSNVTGQCFNCNTHPAEVWCRDCHNKGFCSECYSNLHKHTALSDHRPCEAKPPKVFHCSNHSTKKLKYWCPENERIYCSNCLAEKQDTHKCELVSDAIKVIADKIRETVKAHPLTINPKEEVDKMYAEYEKSSNEKKANIAEQYAAMRKMIDDHEKSTNESIAKIDKENIDQIKDYEIRVMDKWRRLRERQMLFNQKIKTGEYLEVLRYYKSHEEYLAKMAAEWAALKTPKTIHYNIQGLDECCKKLQESLEHANIKQQPSYENVQLQQMIEKEEKNSILNLNNRNLNDYDMIIVAQILRTNQTFTTVYLGNNQIKTVGAKYIAESLIYNRTLTTLDLWNNNIGTDGVQHIAEILRRITNIKSLGLNTNDIQNKGAQYLAEALTHNEILTDLSVTHNSITDIGAQSFVDALKTNKTLQKLQIFNGNHISTELRQKLGKKDTRLI